MRIPLVRPNMPKLVDVQQYYQLAEKTGQYSNFGVVHNIACDKLSRVYPGSNPVLVNNGTTAIQVALQTIGKRGDRVALPTFTFTATLNAVVAAGMTPVLFDVDPNTWQICPELLTQHKAEYDTIIVVSPFGYYVDTKVYDDLAISLHKKMVYDFAPAWGMAISSEYPTTFSFHATKTLPIGEGGAVMFPYRPDSIDARQLVNFDFVNQQPQSMYGLNGKMDELHASVLCAQLDRNDELLDPTRYNRTMAHEMVTNCTSTRPRVSLEKSFLQMPVVASLYREKICSKLEELQVATRRYYYPLLHIAFPDLQYFTNGVRLDITNTFGLPRVDSLKMVEDILYRARQGLPK